MARAGSFKGVIPPLTTPFSAQGAILYQALEQNLDRYLETPCGGWLVLGSNGESVHLSRAERLELIGRVAGRIPADRCLLVGLAEPSLRGGLDFIEKLHRFRIDALLVSVPSYYRDRMDHESLCGYYSQLADHSPFPLLLYNIPQYSGIELSPWLVAELADHPNVSGMKDSSGDLVYLERIQQAIGGRDFQVLLGSARILGAGLTRGIEAAILAVACPLPGMACSVMRGYREGTDIVESQLQLRGLARELGAFGLPGIKYAMDLLGFQGRECRLPLRPLGSDQRTRIRTVLGALLESDPVPSPS